MSKFIVYSDSDSQSNKILGIADSGSNNLICRGKMYVGSDINHNFSSGKVLHVDGDIKFTGNLYKGNVDITTDPASGGTTNYLTLAGGGNVMGPINMNSNKITGLPSGGSGSDAARWNELPDATVYLSKTLTTPQTMAGNIDMGTTKKITGLALGTNPGEAITYDQLPDASSYLSKTLTTPQTMSGNIDMGTTKKITGLAEGTGSDAARFQDLPVLGQYLSKTLTTSQTMSGNIDMGTTKKITGLAEGGASGEAVTYDQIPDPSNYLSIAGGTMTGNIDMGGNKIEGLPPGGSGSDAARWDELPTASDYLPIAGGTMTNHITMDGNKITGLAQGTNPGDAIRVDQVSGSGGFLSLSGGTMTGNIDMDDNKITGLPSDGSGSDAARWDELPTATDYLLIAGDTMTGDIAMGGNKITGLPSGSGSDAARWDELPDKDDYLLIAGGTMTGNIAMGGNKITGLPSGSGSDAARWDELPDATDYLSKTLTTSQTMSGEINMNNKRITGLADGTGSGDAVTYAQYAALNDDLDTRYKRDGSNPITGDLDLGTNTIIGIGTSNVSLPTNTAADNDYLKIKNIDNGTGVTTTEWAVAPATVNSFSVYGGTTKIQGDVSIIGAGSHTGETNAGGGYTGLVLGGSNAGGDNSAAICFQTKNSTASTYSNKMIISKRGCLSINKNSSVNKADVKFEVKGDSYFNGRVGIGTSNPQYPLHVAAASAYQGTMDSSFVMEYQEQYSTYTGNNVEAIYTTGASSSHTNAGTTQYSGIDAYIGRIGCDSIYFSSDIRIKTNICDLEDDEALINLRKLKPKRYEYIDKIDRGGHSVYGFIAQDVREVFPEATRLETRHIPNIMGSGVISQNVITYYIRNTSTLTVGVNIRVMGEDLDYTTATVTEILNDKTFRVDDESLSELPDNSTVFVYGTAVDDFHVLQKDAIWTIATAALQEVDRQIQAEKVKVSSLESSMADALARITALENAN